MNSTFCTVASTPDPDIAGIGVRISVYGQAILGLLTATQDDPEPLRSVYIASIITTVALLISTVAKVSQHLMSYYHIHVLIVYLGILGGPMVLALFKLEEELQRSPLLLSAQFVWAGATLGLAIYGLAVNNAVKEDLEKCPNIQTGNLWSSQKWAIVIDSFAMLFGLVALNRAVTQLAQAAMPLLSQKITAALDRNRERFRKMWMTICDKTVYYFAGFFIELFPRQSDPISILRSGLLALLHLSLAMERYANPQEMEEAERTDFLMTPLLICFGEAYRAAYTPILSGQSEGNWTFGQIFPVTLLLLPVVELIRNASSPVPQGGISKFRSWVNHRDHIPFIFKDIINGNGITPFTDLLTQLIIGALKWLYNRFIDVVLKPIFAYILFLKDAMVLWGRKSRAQEFEGQNERTVNEEEVAVTNL